MKQLLEYILSAAITGFFEAVWFIFFGVILGTFWLMTFLFLSTRRPKSVLVPVPMPEQPPVGTFHGASYGGSN